MSGIQTADITPVHSNARGVNTVMLHD